MAKVPPQGRPTPLQKDPRPEDTLYQVELGDLSAFDCAEDDSADELIDDIPPHTIPPDSFGSRSRIRPWVWWTLGTVAILGALIGGWYALPIRQVSVSGQEHLTESEVKRLAGLNPGFGWLYYGAWRAKGLAQSPWVASAQITRTFPDHVDIQIVERQPFLRLQTSRGEIVGVATDGHLLPRSAEMDRLPLVRGWGPDRLPEVLLVARVLSRYTVQSVAYSPSGFTVNTAQGQVWSGDPKSIVKYAGSISMYPNQQINIYPWGVSVQE